MRVQSVLQELKDVNYSVISEYIIRRISEYITESGKNGGIIGLSGGIDSSVTTVLLSKATQNYFILLMPSSSTPQKDMEDAKKIINMIGANNKYKIINIDPILESFKNEIKTNDKLVLGNIKARIRMILLYAYAQIMNYLVIGTGDKSELLLGYFTKYGDGGVDILPIGDLYKTQVRELGRYLGLPEDIVTKPSSPALWEGQTAEGELGVSYDIIDAVLYLRVEKMMDIESIAKELQIDTEIVHKIDRMIKTSQHKRLPPEIFRLSGRAINSDWRYPREWI
ncbi:NAD+ synthase [Acidianus ambivalens]|uniref:NH(3)-dependent NAD(+) synthetase n=1 Tax=Acidianus ambivalens TaxID=2283 RepID=A0A650CWB3_ACIAM|nr:NAD+ synthase [Acidianus ambivalens]MQL55686.1 NAD+ synthase [Acidianus ambivalens]QGR21737.1 NAD+ synthase [Acidianus ambivalens]